MMVSSEGFILRLTATQFRILTCSRVNIAKAATKISLRFSLILVVFELYHLTCLFNRECSSLSLSGTYFPLHMTNLSQADTVNKHAEDPSNQEPSLVPPEPRSWHIIVV